MFNIQCKDLMMVISPNTKLSILYNLLSAGVALWVIFDEVLDKLFKEGVRCEDGVRFSSSTQLYLSHQTCNNNRIASNNVLFV
jgi:hypothetical protein